MPTCLQMILDRHGFKPESQAEILYKLGLTIVPRRRRASFRGARLRKKSLISRYEKMKKGDDELVAIRRYLTRERIPLTVEARRIDDFRSKRNVLKYLVRKLRDGSDVILRIYSNYNLYNSDDNSNHALLLKSVRGETLHLLDPFKSKSWTMRFNDLSALVMLSAIGRSRPRVNMFIFSRR